jgi:hypothetical protein
MFQWEKSFKFFSRTTDPDKLKFTWKLSDIHRITFVENIAFEV